ncbi:MAG: PEP/pyruvate-binding domain-containing protein [Thermodesulfobacteriota bacterium]|nr:PEP/pyruvate-binding domain-containing protein [Thermodesulfobacteriota bacterium]
MKKKFLSVFTGASFLLLTALSGSSLAAASQDLTATQKKMLTQNWKTIQHKVKGPYSVNYCVCTDGSKKPVQAKDGSIANRCKKTNFCGAFRAPWGEALTETGMYVGNIFSSDLFDWDKISDHHNLVRGYILENYYMTAHPESKLAQMQTYGGLKGAEYEARDMPIFQEKYLAGPTYNDYRHYILAYELEQRFFTRNDQGNIQKIRNLAIVIQQEDHEFKPLRDAVHGRIAASLLPLLADYRDKLLASKKKEKGQINELIADITKLTSLDESILGPQIDALSDAAVKELLEKLINHKTDDPVKIITTMAELMVLSRHAVANKEVTPPDSRKLFGINVTGAAVIQSLGSKLMDEGGPETVRQSLQLLRALANATYGTGLISERERKAITENFDVMLAKKNWNREEFTANLKQVQQVIEWSHAGALLGFGEVWPAWSYLIPDIQKITDDIVRSSPMLLYGMAYSKLEDFVSGQEKISHLLFDTEFTKGVRALNSGLAFGDLAVVDVDAQYGRDKIIALPDTPADLEPAAGIITRGEGNVVSHVQLLARALGIPNVVVGTSPYEVLKKHNNDKVLFIVTPGGRVYLKRAADMTAEDKVMYKEYTRSRKRTGDGKMSTSKARLHIDPSRLDIEHWQPISLDDLRRSDSGHKTGPKAAYLGELKHLFPDNVARGVAVPFGAYYQFYKSAKIMVPKKLTGKHIAESGRLLDDFAKETYAEFFGKMVPAGTSDAKLAAWIKPRLQVIRYTLENNKLSPELKKAIRDDLAKLGLLKKDDPSQTVGLFVRSDTNVEDQPNFNGAGLNLTIFNIGSLDDIYQGLKKVWASPFTYRSFSWRQTLIDEPLWVLPSVVLLESIPSEASGVLITADINTGDQTKMLLGTSEGVGGAVDGTPTETLLWSPDGVKLVTTFKSPWRRLVTPGSGTGIVPSTGREYVLSPEEVKAITRAGLTIRKNFKPALDKNGNPKAWDIEYGFAKGKLWLFQCRPFIGNEDFSNIPALAGLDKEIKKNSGNISLDDAIK